MPSLECATPFCQRSVRTGSAFCVICGCAQCGYPALAGSYCEDCLDEAKGMELLKGSSGRISGK